MLKNILIISLLLLTVNCSSLNNDWSGHTHTWAIAQVQWALPNSEDEHGVDLTLAAMNYSTNLNISAIQARNELISLLKTNNVSENDLNLILNDIDLQAKMTK